MRERQDFGLPNAGDGSLVPEDFIPNEVVSANSNVVAQTDVADPGRRGAVTRSNGLEQLQAQFPFLPISPLPNQVDCYYGIDGSGATGNLNVPVPAGAKMMRLSSTKVGTPISNTFYSLFGSIPRAFTSTGSVMSTGGRTITNELGWQYCVGKTSVDLHFISSFTVVSIEFFIQL